MRRLTSLLVLLIAAPASAAEPGATFLLDRPSGFGALPNDSVNYTVANPSESVSDNGRFVVFESDSDGLLPAGADPRYRHVFVRDLQTDTTTLVDASASDVPGDGEASSAAISGDGNFIVFTSGASNLTGDIVAERSLYRKNRVTRAIELVSRRTGVAGTPDSGFVSDPSIDTDGNVIAWTTFTSLEAADDNGAGDVYARNTTTDVTTLISRKDGAGGDVGSDYASNPAVSGDGSRVAFDTASALDTVNDTNGDFDVYVRTGNSTSLVSRIDGAGTAAGNDQSYFPSLNADGSVIAFTSDATDLAGADTNSGADVFVRQTGTSDTVMVSRPSGSAVQQGNRGSFASEVSANGGHVGFSSGAGNLVSGVGEPPEEGFWGYVRNLATTDTSLVSVSSGGAPADATTSGPALNADGTVAVFHGNAGNLGGPGADPTQVYVRNRTAGTTEHASRPGADASPPATASRSDASGYATTVSADGRLVVFSSESDGLADADDDRYQTIFLRDTVTGETKAVSGGAGGDSYVPVISVDGSRVAFVTFGRGYGPEGAYAYDVATGNVELASRATGADGAAASPGEYLIALSGDGRRLAFEHSDALDPAHDTNGAPDVYVRDLVAKTTVLASRADGADTNAGNDLSGRPVLDGTGNRVAFYSSATNLGDGDTTPTFDVHVRDLAAQTTTLVSRATGPGTPPGNAGSLGPSISADGNRIAFLSRATDLGNGDTTPDRDVHVRDLAASTTTLVSREGASGSAGDGGESSDAIISGDGGTVLFTTSAENLLPPGVELPQVVARTLVTGTSTVVSRADGADGALASSGARAGGVNADGSCAMFGASGPELVAGGYPSPDFGHVYLRVLKRECPLVPPDTTLTAGAATSFSFTSSEPGSTFECRVDGAAFASCTSPVTPAAPDGTHTFAVRATDKAGLVDPTPAEAQFVLGDEVAPVLSRVRLSRKRFRAGAKRTPVTVAAKKGTVLRFTLSEAASVRIAVQRRAGKKWKAVRALTRAGKAGSNRVGFSGRIGKKRLERGRHRMVLRATDPAGNRSKVKRVRFRIVRR